MIRPKNSTSSPPLTPSQEKNKSYWKFDFSLGTVIVIFSFLWTDNAPCLPPLLPNV